MELQKWLLIIHLLGACIWVGSQLILCIRKLPKSLINGHSHFIQVDERVFGIKTNLTPIDSYFGNTTQLMYNTQIIPSAWHLLLVSIISIWMRYFGVIFKYGIFFLIFKYEHHEK